MMQADASAVRVGAARDVSYEVVHTTRGVFNLQENTLAARAGGRDVLIVVDHRVHQLYGDDIRRYGARRLRLAGIALVDGTEDAKSWAQVERVCAAALERRLPRDGVIVGVGGGSALDIAGLAAAVFRRGVAYVRIPTTLVGMVDVCVGIKHAVNFMGEKSALGAFYPPACGINDLSLLRTLPPRQISCGLAEIIKIAMVRGERLFDTLEAHVDALLRSRFQEPIGVALEVAVDAERLMAGELAPNLFEACRSRLVDFGHSVSPRLEAAAGFRLPHGEAVAIDMALSTALSVERGLCSDRVLDRLLHLCDRAALPVTQTLLTAEELWRCLQEVRRHRRGAINLVVPLAVGHAGFLQEVTPDEIAAAARLIDARVHPPSGPVHAGAGF